MTGHQSRVLPFNRLPLLAAAVIAVALAGCRDSQPTGDLDPIPGTVAIAAGSYAIGSTGESRESALAHAGVAQTSTAKRLLDSELPAGTAHTPGFLAGIFPVTCAEYAKFAAATGHRTPGLSRDEWYAMANAAGLGLNAEGSFEGYVLPTAWIDGRPPAGLENSPVVLVSKADAVAYCAWLSKELNRRVRLPDEIESEILGGSETYPWGNQWQFGRSHADAANRNPIPVGSTSGTPLLLDGFLTVWDTNKAGVRDYAGQVYEWTSTPSGKSRNESVVKGGGSFMDGPIESRRSARRIIPDHIKHPMVGFRIVIDPK